MLCDRLTCHVETCTQLVQCLAIASVETVQQAAPAGIREGTKDVVLTHADIMQPNGCLSRREKGPCADTALDAINRDGRR